MYQQCYSFLWGGKCLVSTHPIQQPLVPCTYRAPEMWLVQLGTWICYWILIKFNLNRHLWLGLLHHNTSDTPFGKIHFFKKMYMMSIFIIYTPNLSLCLCMLPIVTYQNRKYRHKHLFPLERNYHQTISIKEKLHTSSPMWKCRPLGLSSSTESICGTGKTV